MGFRGILAMLAGMAVTAARGGTAQTVQRVPVERPPQFVMLAFDNCTELERWRDLSAFSAEMNRDGARLHFTFFVSGVNYIEDASRNVYQGPGQRRGYSRINFGGSADDVRKRIDYVNALYAQGHEIASHAIGHFDGAHWSAAQWEREFSTYRDIVANAGSFNARASTSRLDVPLAKIVGFRAPYLSAGAGLYEALRHDGFRYDTSSTAFPDQWPQKLAGIWRFNLAQLRIAGLGRATLSMDYNFSVAQSHARPDPRHAEAFKQQMLATYLAYFRASYAGNRAPLNIGHHFEAYQGGVYNEALKEFARRVCGLPEVKCAAYSELADFMDQQSPETLAAYQHGDFPHAAPPVTTAAAHAP
jgi:peptidoglycan/xylan/chitin deacetylase (PgdA/CDA1 family)